MSELKTFDGSRVVKVDSKGRLSVPASMRNNLGNEFIVSFIPNDCVALYPKETWDNKMNQIQEKYKDNGKALRERLRFCSSKSQDWSLDVSGRILINDFFKEKSSIEITDELVCMGVHDRIELWNKAQYDEKFADYANEEICDELENIGL